MLSRRPRTGVPVPRRFAQRPTTRLLAVSLGVALTAACQSAEPADDTQATDTMQRVDAAAEEATIRQLTLDWGAAEASNDDSLAMSYMWEDAVMQPPGMPQIEGHEEIRALYESVEFESLEVGSLTVKVNGDLAVVWGSLDTSLTGPAGPVTDQGKFVAVWERRDGEWKVVENTWNSDLTPGGGVAAPEGGSGGS